MRILVLATTFPRRAGDTVPMFVHDLAVEMDKLGHEVSVLAPHAPGAARREQMGPLDVHRFRYFAPVSRQRLAYGGGILNNVRGSLLAKMQVAPFAAQFVRHARRVCREQRIEAVHSHWVIPCGYVGSWVAKGQGVPHVATMHAGDVAGLAKLPARERISGYVLHRTERIVAVSNYIADRFRACVSEADRALLEPRLSVMPMGVDVGGLQSGPADGEAAGETVLFIGRLVEKKGVPTLLEAMKGILRERPHAKLLVCGTGPLREQLEATARAAGIAGSVRFLGFVTDEQKARLLRARPILAVPSIEASSGDVEGLPVTILEGLAAGCAVVATRTGGVADVLVDGENGVLVQPGDVADLSRAIAGLLESPQARRRLGDEARQRAWSFDWPRIAKAYEALFAASAR